MNSISLDISQKIKPDKAALLSIIHRVAGRLGMPFFVVGATARDFIQVKSPMRVGNEEQFHMISHLFCRGFQQ